MEILKDTNGDLLLSDNIILIIKENNVNRKALTILLILALLSILIPLIMLIHLIQLSEGLPFGFIISCVLFTLAFGYLMKLYLWNKYGQEVFTISPNEFTLYCDYGYFKDFQCRYHYNLINVLIDYNGKLRKLTPQILDNIEDGEPFYITFFVDDKVIKSKNPVSIRIIWRIVQYLDKK